MYSYRTKRILLILLVSLSSLCIKANGGEKNASGNHDAFCQSLDELFAGGYPQQLMNYFCSLGTNPDLGFRWAGTTAEHATSERIEQEMRKMGLSNVRREPVPVDVFEFKKASVKVGSREMTCSSFTGVRPTTKSGITAPVVYAKGGSAADFDSVGDVSGKIVLLDYLPTSGWLSDPVFEAAHRKAAGIILTITLEDPKYYTIHSQALGSFDSAGDFSLPPYVYLSLQDGLWLKSQVLKEDVRATMILDQKVTLARDGGVGYNVVGELPGTNSDGQLIVLLAHQDAHFQGALDDTSGIVNMLTIAKAMCTRKVPLQHTMVFMATCAEEFGRVNSYFDYLIGAWWAISHEHRDWIGRTRAVINIELMGLNGTPLDMTSNPELKPWFKQLAMSYPHYLPYGSYQKAPVHSWNDQWPFTALGIPSVVFAMTGDFGTYPLRYHTNYDTPDLIDWKYLAQIGKFIHKAVQGLDVGLLPYDLLERGRDLESAINREELQKSGADPIVVSGLMDTVDGFKKEASIYQSHCQSILPGKIKVTNNRLLEIERILNKGLTALSSEGLTCYPHQQVLTDANGLKCAITALQAHTPDTRLALKVLEKVGDTKLGIRFSEEVYQRLLERKNPDYKNLHWASEGKLPVPLNVIPEYRAIQKGDITTAISGLREEHRLRIQDLNNRLREMTSVLREAHTLLKQIQVPVENDTGDL
ncbi:M28 family peptidase [Planctomycetota bacterium]